MSGSRLSRLRALLVAPAASGTNYTLTAQGGSYTLTGQSATLLRSKRIVASGGAYTQTGGSAVIKRDRKLAASGGAYSYTGQQVTITYTPAAVNYTLTAQGGTYSVTGQSATLLRDKLLTASGGSYSLTGQQATLLRSKRIVASGGDYTLTGQSATILRSKVLSATGGTYSITGSDAVISKSSSVGYVLTCLGGEYTLSGGDASLQVGRATQEIQWLGGGSSKKKRDPYAFLDPQHWITPAVAEAVTKVAKQALEPKEQGEANYIPEQALKAVLDANKEAWSDFYAELLRQQIEAERNRQIQQHLIALQVISQEVARQIQEEEDEERAILELLMEL